MAGRSLLSRGETRFHPNCIIVVGSHACGEAGPDSLSIYALRWRLIPARSSVAFVAVKYWPACTIRSTWRCTRALKLSTRTRRGHLLSAFDAEGVVL
jgi:hypothetical protein